MLTGRPTKRLPKRKVTSSREPPAPAQAGAGQRRRETRGGGAVGDQQGQGGASRRLRRLAGALQYPQCLRPACSLAMAEVAVPVTKAADADEVLHPVPVLGAHHLVDVIASLSRTSHGAQRRSRTPNSWRVITGRWPMHSSRHSAPRKRSSSRGLRAPVCYCSSSVPKDTEAPRRRPHPVASRVVPPLGIYEALYIYSCGRGRGVTGSTKPPTHGRARTPL